MTQTMEQILRVVTAYTSGPYSLVFVIPREYHAKKGQKFLVKKDQSGRLIYQPLPEATKDGWNRKILAPVCGGMAKGFRERTDRTLIISAV